MDKQTVKLTYGPLGGYNDPGSNERKVELPVAFWFIKEYKDNLIEIGEVSSFYEEPKHTVYDLVKEIGTTIIKDAIDVDYTDANVISISTIEHVGTGDYGHKPEDNKAWKLYEKIKNESKNYLISFPVGYNKEFEKVLTDNNVEYILMKRDQNNNWTSAKDQSLSDFEYNNPYYAGNAVAFLTNLDIEFIFGE